MYIIISIIYLQVHTHVHTIHVYICTWHTYRYAQKYMCVWITGEVHVRLCMYMCMCCVCVCVYVCVCVCVCWCTGTCMSVCMCVYMYSTCEKKLLSSVAVVLRQCLSGATCNKTSSHNAMTMVLQCSTVPPVIEQCYYNCCTGLAGPVHLAYTYNFEKLMIVLSTMIIAI